MQTTKVNGYTSLLGLEELSFDRPDFDDMRIQGINEFSPTQATVTLSDGTVLGKCARAVWFEKVGVPKEKLSVRVKRRFDFGHIAEDYFVERHKSLGIFVNREKSFAFQVPRTNLVIRGRFDEIVILDAKYVGVEIKTGHGQAFMSQHVTGYKRKPKYGQAHLLNPLQPSPRVEYILQAALYLYYTKYIMPLINGISISEWRLLHLAVDTMVGAEFVVTLEENGAYHRIKVERIYVSSDNDDHSNDYMEIQMKDIYVEDIFNKFMYIYNCIKDGTVPYADYWFDKPNDEEADWQCDYCPYRYLCNTLPREETDGQLLISMSGQELVSIENVR